MNSLTSVVCDGPEVGYQFPPSYRFYSPAGGIEASGCFMAITTPAEASGPNLERDVLQAFAKAQAAGLAIWSMMGTVQVMSGEPCVRLAQTLEGYRHWVLDEQGAETEEGELCIEGRSLADGYWQRDDLTEQAFVSWQGRRLYRTGDRVRRVAEDAFQYLGRRDDQIKLRGFRIELGEIEAALRSIDGVQDAAVRLLGEGEEASLVGYVELREDGPGRMQIRRMLQRNLPHYMIPGRIVRLTTLPKTASGKIDRKRLPEPV
ncbi:AMP-binding enzyme [Stutzerimonas nitrititolerans]